MRKRLIIVAALCFALLPGLSLQAQQDTAKKKSYAELTKDLERIEGYIPLLYDPGSDEMFLEVSRLGNEFLYHVSLPTGVGSNFIGLDRGQPGSTKIVYFERAGNKLLLVQPNYNYRALSKNDAERKAVEESFAKSVIWGFKIEAEENGKMLVNATSFFLRDAHGVGARLEQTKQGTYKMEGTRSAFYKPNIKGFPKNTEIETIITLVSAGPTGWQIRRTAPSGDAVTVRQRHSLVELPDPHYKPREFDPRVSSIPISFYDYATGINENLEKRWIVRHRLNRKFSNVPESEAVEPIIYYVDNGAPPAIRDALIEGALWWNQAFEAAGYKDAFQVKVLPPDADPMDIRYNVINWVHRSTRGWAYGSSVTDPRTGEIIKGVVTLDSQRARQDFMIGTGLAPQYTGSSNTCDFALMPEVDYLPQTDSDASALALARIKQLSAHEVGHTLGFAHNFAASTYGRASVMDYPAPMIEIVDGRLDFSRAYADGIGAFDKFSVQYAYTDFPNGTDERAELRNIVERGVANAMLFISDEDARPAGAAHPLANLWDNGPDPVARLAHELSVRRIGLAGFGLKNLKDGDALSELEHKLLPLYLHHRYQLTAAVKSIGGTYYTYSVRSGEKASPARVFGVVDPKTQRAALETVLSTLSARDLMVSENVLSIVPPQAFGTDSQRSERFEKNTDPILDPLGMAEIAANITARALLEPHRAARLETFNARNPENPGFTEVLRALIGFTWGVPVASEGYEAAVQRSVQTVVAEALMDLAGNENTHANIRNIANAELRILSSDLRTRGPISKRDREHLIETAIEIERFLERPAAPRTRTRQLADPPSDPIGASLDN